VFLYAQPAGHRGVDNPVSGRFGIRLGAIWYFEVGEKAQNFHHVRGDFKTILPLTKCRFFDQGQLDPALPAPVTSRIAVDVWTP